MSKSDVKKLKAAAKKIDACYKVTDRNGSLLLFPKINEDQLQSIKSGLKVYAVDGLLGKDWDVVGEPDMSNGFANFNLVEHGKERQMAFSMPQEDLMKIIGFVHKNNFSSVDKFVSNMLPSFNGPDKACFIGINYGNDGIKIGFILPLPAYKIA